MNLNSSYRIFLGFALAVFFTLQGNGIISKWFLNRGSHILFPEWREVSQIERDTCKKIASKSQALHHIIRSLEFDISNNRAWLSLGRVNWLTGNYDGSIEALEKAVEYSDTDPIARLELTRNQMACGTYSVLEFQEPTHGIEWYFFRLGLSAENSGFQDIAADYYLKSMEIRKTRIVAERLVTIYSKQDKDADIRDIWNRIVDNSRINEDLHWWAQAELARIDNAWSLAGDYFFRGALISKEPYQYFMQAGHSYRRSLKWHEASQAYQRALELNPDSTWTMQALGQLYFAQEDYHLAKEWFILSLAHNPGNLISKYYLSQVFYKTGELELAISELKCAIDLHQGMPWEWAIMLGDWLLENNDTDNALVAYFQAREWAPMRDEIQDRIDEILNKSSEDR